jgi:uncharacterized protein YndB with AHSA1/START domain
MSNARTAIPSETTLVLTRTYQAPCERVFAVWLDKQVLRRFMAPEGCSVTAVSLDARVGGSFSIALNTPSGEMKVRGEYLEIRRPDLIAFTWKWDEDEPSQEHESCVTLEFRDRGDATELVLTHERLRDSESRDKHARGWESIAENLAPIVAGAARNAD